MLLSPLFKNCPATPPPPFLASCDQSGIPCLQRKLRSREAKRPEDQAGGGMHVWRCPPAMAASVGG